MSSRLWHRIFGNNPKNSSSARPRCRTLLFFICNFCVALPLLAWAYLPHQVLALADSTDQVQTKRSNGADEEKIKKSQLPASVRGNVLGNPQEAIDDFKQLYALINVYRGAHGGNYPSSLMSLWEEVSENPKLYGFVTSKDGLFIITNSDVRYISPDISLEQSQYTVSYRVSDRRLDGSLVGAPHQKGTRDALAWCDIYVYNQTFKDSNGIDLLNPVGFYIVLWDDGQVEKIPYDKVIYFPIGFGGADFKMAFPNQAGIPFGAFSVDEFNSLFYDEVVRGKPIVGERNKPILDNGGPEALVSFSRQLSIQGQFGISRQAIWERFDPTQKEFSLDDLKVGAVKLGLSLQSDKLSLSQLQQHNGPAILLTNDGSLITLLGLNDRYALISDQGLIRIVDRSLLEAKYNGESLISDDLKVNTSLDVDEPIREVKLPSLDAEVPQQFVLRNTGTTPITLQLEYPLLGVTESKLSRDTIAPGETATLDIKVKWRSILKAPYQNVLVSLQTNDPIVPRLQLAVLLTPPAQTGN